VDSIRVRRLFEHWITEGVLAMQEAEGSPSPQTDDTQVS
jgi:hypothetical protein